jgi:hypothetical protein
VIRDLEDWFAAQHHFVAYFGLRFVVHAGRLVFEVAE